MRKVFIEPALQKIELNLRENIASSSDEDDGHMYIKVLKGDYFSCFVMNTGKLIFAGLSEAELQSCTVYGADSAAKWSYGRNIPMEELRPYIKG